MTGSPKKPAPDRSLSAFVEGVAQLLRTEARELSLKERDTKVLKKGAAHKIEQIALLLRQKAHETRSKKTKRSPKRSLATAPAKRATSSARSRKSKI